MTTTKKTTKTKAVKTVKARSSTSIPSLPNNPFVFEVLDAASKQRSKAKKVEVLQRYKHPSLVTLFVWNFDQSIVSMLPEGPVPYGTNRDDQNATGTLSSRIDDAVSKMAEMGSTSLGSQDQGQASIRAEYKKFYNFCKGGNPTLSNLRRETMFINILEGLHPLEAELLILVKDKNLETKYKISKEVVSTAYPEIVWGDRS
jgi:hypothetical protein|tara:strand:- start:718 stop:1320 length:603 start_codon:yes stop_codon:yes gene_type:complete